MIRAARFTYRGVQALGGTRAMAMNTGGERGGLNADINVTPLVDVMLVLLIIMMLIAPMVVQRGIQMPEATNTGTKPDNQEQTVVAIDARGAFYVNALPVAPESLIPHVQRILEAKKEK